MTTTRTVMVQYGDHAVDVHDADGDGSGGGAGGDYVMHDRMITIMTALHMLSRLVRSLTLCMAMASFASPEVATAVATRAGAFGEPGIGSAWMVPHTYSV